jgi:hypothetical protein
MHVNTQNKHTSTHTYTHANTHVCIKTCTHTHTRTGADACPCPGFLHTCTELMRVPVLASYTLASYTLAHIHIHAQELMRDPVLASDGYSYERSAIEQWLRSHDTSPMSNQVCVCMCARAHVRTCMCLITCLHKCVCACAKTRACMCMRVCFATVTSTPVRPLWQTDCQLTNQLIRENFTQ